MSGTNGLAQSMKPGSTIIVTATIAPAEIRQVGKQLSETEIQLVDAPVSGGKSGADNAR